MKQLVILNPEHATQEEIGSYKVRHAARAVILDADHNIAMLHVSKQKYCKLPGGGIKVNESELSALRRECLEEAGVEIEIIGEIGSIVEYRKIFHLIQTSSCYLARIVGDKGDPHFTLSELRDGFKLNWLPYPKIMFCLGMCVADNIEGRDYIVPRDKLFLQQAKKLFGNEILPLSNQSLCG